MEGFTFPQSYPHFAGHHILANNGAIVTIVNYSRLWKTFYSDLRRAKTVREQPIHISLGAI